MNIVLFIIIFLLKVAQLSIEYLNKETVLEVEILDMYTSQY